MHGGANTRIGAGTLGAGPPGSPIGSSRLRSLPFQIVLPLRARREAVHHRAMSEGALGGGDVFAPARPSLLRCRLQRAAVAEREPPRHAADAVQRPATPRSPPDVSRGLL